MYIHISNQKGDNEQRFEIKKIILYFVGLMPRYVFLSMAFTDNHGCKSDVT